MSQRKISDEINERPVAGVTCRLLLATSMAVVGSTFQFGYHTGVINAPQAVIEQFYNATFTHRYGEFIDDATLSFLWGFSVAIFAAGGMAGSLAASFLVRRFGLKRSMIYNNALALAASLAMGFSGLVPSFELFIIGRLVIGANCGINMGLAPVYLTEVAPLNYRGMFGTLSQLGIVTSLLLSQVLGLPWLLGTKELWPLLVAFSGVFSIFQLMVAPFCPESPKQLLFRNKKAEAAAVLRMLRGKTYNVTKELQEMDEEISDETQRKKMSIKEVLFSSSSHLPLIIAIVMQLSQQLSGINAVFYYSTQIFLAAGIPQSYTGLATLGMGVVNVAMTTVSMLLIERLGRRTLHLVGLGGMFFMAATLALLLMLPSSPTASWCTLGAILLFVVFFQTGPGSIPWFITAELFDQASRPAAVSLAGLVNWMGNFAVALAYPTLELSIGGGFTFVIFAVMLAAFWLFTYIKVPETKGLAIWEIKELFSQHKMQYSKSTML